jgi:Tol biopolymer transport system component
MDIKKKNDSKRPRFVLIFTLTAVLFAAQSCRSDLTSAEKPTSSRMTAGDSHPSWSPDGTRIVFQSRIGTNSEIYMMDADGSNQIRLTNDPADDEMPSWSPDGKRIIFSSNRDGNREIYVMNADGSNQIRLTNNPANDWEPSWSPDGKRIAFESSRGGNRELFLFRIETKTWKFIP